MKFYPFPDLGKMRTLRAKQKSQTAELAIWDFFMVPGAGVENMDVVKRKNKFLNSHYGCILLKYK